MFVQSLNYLSDITRAVQTVETKALAEESRKSNLNEKIADGPPRTMYNYIHSYVYVIHNDDFSHVNIMP